MAAFVMYVPLFQRMFGSAAVSVERLLLMLSFPLVVWGADEIRRWLVRRRAGAPRVGS